MTYTGIYYDEKGNAREVSITEEDSREALRNDRKEVMRRYNPKRVSVREVMAKPGEALRLEMTVHAKSHYLISSDDATPKECDSMTVTVVCFLGYPVVQVKAFYPSNHYLASLNVFRSGDACIDKWVIMESSLITVMDKLARDMIHFTEITREDSKANSSLWPWYERCKNNGEFPTIPPVELFAPEMTALPPRRAASKPVSAPPLPGRRH